MSLVALLLLGCGGPDPELVTQRDAIAAWRDGKAALDAGRQAEAVVYFDRALALRPEDGLLLGWRAKALADAGDLDGAIDAAERGLALAPLMAEVRYDRAAWLARSGRLDEAGNELRRALQHGASDPLAAAADPDFASHLGHASFAFLPRAGLEPRLVLPESLFWGSQAGVRLEVAGARTPVVVGSIEGPIELVSGTERHGPAGVEVEWTVIARGAGEVRVGPLEVRDGARAAEVEAASFAAMAPPDKPAAESRRVDLATTTSLAAGLDIPGAAAGPGQVRVVAPLHHKASLAPEAGRRQRFERWSEGESALRVHRWVDLPPGSYTVVVVDAGVEVLREVVVVTAEAGPPG